MSTNNKIVVNQERAVEVCTRIALTYKKQVGLFANPEIKKIMFPESMLVKAVEEGTDFDELERFNKALVLFLMLPADRNVVSSKFYSQAAEFYKANGTWFFDLEQLMMMSESRIEELINRNIKPIYKPREFAHSLVFNSKKLKNEYNGNILSLFHKSDNYTRAIERLKQFHGYGKPIASLLLTFFARYDLLRTPGISPKVDRHLTRISESTGIYVRGGNPRADSIAAKLSRVFEYVIQSQGLDNEEFNPQMWAIGNQLCVRQSRYHCRTYCPIENLCSKVQPTISKANSRLYDRKMPAQQELDF
jgi:endonuclease III